MIHQLLCLKRSLFILDTETTSLNTQTARIVEIGFQQWDQDGLKKEWRSLINPDILIPAAASKVNGITDATMKLCTKCKRERSAHDFVADVDEVGHRCEMFHPVPTFRQLATSLAKGFRDCDFAGKNVRFDLRTLATEFARADVAWGYIDARVIDVDRLEQLGEPRTLASLYKKHLGCDMEDAHQALSDVRATAEVISAQLSAYATLPRDLDILHEAQWPGWIDSEGKFKFVDGVACFGQWGKHAGKPMKEVDIGYWDFILKESFSADIKKLVVDAKLGKFPEPR